MTQRVYFDTNFLISVFEVAEPVAGHGWSVLQALEAGHFTAVTSELTIAELLPKPLANNDTALVQTYLDLLVEGDGLNVVPVSREVLIGAAAFRAQNRTLRLPDAIHLATASARACNFFLTDDLRLALPAGLTRVRLTATSLDDIRRVGP